MIFTVDWEPWFALYPYSYYWEKTDTLIEEPTYYLLNLLKRHEIKAIWYCLGWLQDNKRDLYQEIVNEGHTIGYHSYYHMPDLENVSPRNVPYRAPKFKGEKRLYSGGFWLRAMPYWWLKREVLKEGQVFIHPHDLLFEHPKLTNPFQNWCRSLGLKNSRDKLERLCREVEFASSVPQSTLA